MSYFDEDAKPVMPSAASSPLRKVSKPLQEIITSSPSHSSNIPLTPTTSNPNTKPTTPEDEKENASSDSISATETFTSSTGIPTTTHSASTTTPAPNPPTFLSIPKNNQEFANSDSDDLATHLECWARETGPTRVERLYVEHDYKVERRKELRLRKIKNHKASMTPELQQALAEASQQRVKKDAEEKERLLEKQLFGDLDEAEERELLFRCGDT